jgi:hypothetical protein
MELAGKAPLLLEQGRYSELLDLLGTVAARRQRCGAVEAALPSRARVPAEGR